LHSRTPKSSPSMETRVTRALVSVWDKSGIVEFAHDLTVLGVEILSSGGTARALAEAGIPVTGVSDVTNAPEILGGRVKTLHPKIHGGILADRRKDEHLEELARHDIRPIDLVVCNLYPFEETIADPTADEDDALEQIDIGGPAMVRAAAKNWPSVAVVVDPRRYGEVLDAISSGGISPELRRLLAVEAFVRTARYDGGIAQYLAGGTVFPQSLVVAAEKVADLRYGENPHQAAAFYRRGAGEAGLAGAAQLHGKELSYNNLLDADAAWKLVCELAAPGAAIIKHSNPCGVAVADTLSTAYLRALECDRTSAFGGIAALNVSCDVETASAIAEIFTEVVIAPSFDDGALETLRAKTSLRILQAPDPSVDDLEFRSVSGGLLVQEADGKDDMAGAKVVTKEEPTSEEWVDLAFAWTVAKHVKSNAIVFARERTAVGIGAGQMSRVESTELAARRAGDRAVGAVCASDAFFPFRDGLDAAVAAGARAVAQPGGSVRDDEVIQAADEHGIAMVFTGRRHFRH
jgi:phosphoribosylaminoimidazolecarboxamide formyltransferase / IMP cyclohydrolase